MEHAEGIVFNIQRYSIDDGPGIRTTVFLKGCPLTCLWCSNPESQSPLPEISYRFTSCEKCGRCVKTCPNSAISLDEEGVHIDRALCKTCGACAQTCVPEALSVSGKSMTVEAVFKTVRRDVDYYESSGGGVTASGGEILMQADFVEALFRRCREEGIHTCADTSGFGSEEAMEKILSVSDLVYFDIKHMDPAAHRETTGQSNDVVLRNLDRVIEKKVPVVIRMPLIPGYNSGEENLSATAKAVAERAPGATIHILPYHRYGASKYRSLDKTYPLEGLEPLTPEQIARAKEIMESHGLHCEVSK